MDHRIRSVRTPVAAFLLAAAFSGCAAGPGSGPEMAQWTLTEDLRIGSASDPSQALSEVSSLTVDDAGRVYVAQWQEGRIRVFDAGGGPLPTIGQRGSGPGQFDRIYTVGFVADTLYAIDFGHRRISYFWPEGELLRTHQVSPPPAIPPFYPGMPFAVFADGSMAPGNAWAATISMEELRRVPQLRVDLAGERVDTVAWIGYERTARRVNSEQRPLMVGSPLTDDAFAIFASDGSRIVTVDRTVASDAGAATFGVTVSDGWGDTLYTRRYEYEPVEVAQAVIDEAVTAGAARLESSFSSPSEAQAFVRSTMFLPTHYPPVSSAVFSRDGTLWLQREAIPERPQQWMVLDEAGEPLAETTMPAGLQVMVIQDDAVWGVLRDGAGVPYVVRYRVRR